MSWTTANLKLCMICDWDSPFRTSNSSTWAVTTWKQSGWLRSLPSLASLELSRNNLKNLDNPRLFGKNPGLLTINLSHNKSSRVHRRLFDKLTDLSSHDLASNELAKIDAILLRGLVNLKSCNLTGKNTWAILISKNSSTFLKGVWTKFGKQSARSPLNQRNLNC